MGIWLDAAERESLGRAVLAAWPEPSPPRLTWLAEGFGSAAFESQDGIIALVAKNEIGVHSRRVTCILTREIAPVLSIAVPMPLWRVEESPGLPFGAYAYTKVPGRLMTEGDAAAFSAPVAEEIGAFLFVMHSYPLSRATERALPGFEALWQDMASLRSTTDATLRRRLTSGEYARVQAWWEAFLGDEALAQAPRCLVHGDLWPHNLLVDEPGKQLLGVIDFGDVQVIDAAYDFAPLRISRTLFDGALAAYERLGGVIDAGFEHRLERWWELRTGSWFSLRAAIRADDTEEIEDALGQLRRSPILARPGAGRGSL